jgi:hypothetical protein
MTDIPHPECVFCLNPIGTERIQYRGCGCRKIPYHDTCILEWFRRSSKVCPICRSNVRVFKELTAEERRAAKDMETTQNAVVCCMCCCIVWPFFTQFL